MMARKKNGSRTVVCFDFVANIDIEKKEEETINDKHHQNRNGKS